MSDARQQYEDYQAKGLDLNMKRGQPSDADFDLSNPMLTVVGEGQVVTPSGIAIRNYPGGVMGLPEARELAAHILGVRPEETIVGNNSSLLLQHNVLTWALLKGLKDSAAPWVNQNPRMMVTVPGYDRHFKLLDTLGFDLITVPMTPDGPDMDVVEAAAAEDERVKGMVFVPVYSNPTGDTVSDETVRRLASMPTAAPDFTIFADNAYAVHHLTDDPPQPLNLLRACEDAGHPDRLYMFGSTSKITFAGAGLGFYATSTANIDYITSLMKLQFIGPNKVEQYRHVKFIEDYPNGLEGLMADHRQIIKPKFDAVLEVLEDELGSTDLATWSQPLGGYFISLDTTYPVADRVVELAQEAGVALTPAGATYPGGHDPTNSNIRLAPTRPPLEEVRQAMQVVAVCVKLASEEHLA